MSRICLLLAVFLATSAAANSTDYYQLISDDAVCGTVDYASLIGDSDQLDNEPLFDSNTTAQLAPSPFTTKTVSLTGADYGSLAELARPMAQPEAPLECPNGMRPYQQPIQQMINYEMPTAYTSVPSAAGESCGASAYAYGYAAAPSCGAAAYDTSQAACGSAAYSTAGARRHSRIERRQARRQLRAQTLASGRGFRPLRRLLGRC